MPIPLLQTKLYIPPPRLNLVARPSVTAKLRAGLRHPLTLIAAPAGFGKTTLVSEWIAQTDHPVAWLSLDDDDNEPTRFLNYLIAALQTQQPEIGKTALGLLGAPQSPAPKTILTLLLNELGARAAPPTLVLDDYHLITTLAIHEALAFMVDHLPPSVHLIITSRMDPPLPLARWRVRNQLTELRADDLRFTAQEAATFLITETPAPERQSARPPDRQPTKPYQPKAHEAEEERDKGGDARASLGAPRVAWGR